MTVRANGQLGGTGGRMDIGDIARLAGVSRSTVSYALSGKRPISAKTRERVFEVMRDAGYVPNASAQALRSGTTNTLAMVIPPADHNHLTTGQLLLIGAAVEAAADRDYDVLMSPGTHDRLGSVERLITARRIDGLLLTEAQVQDPRVKRTQQSGLPFVVIGRTTDRPSYDWVDVDWDGSVRSCVRHLVEVGRRKLVLINRSAALVNAGYGAAVRSDKAFHDELASLGLRGEAVACDDNVYASTACVREILETTPDVDGIISINEMSLPGLVPALTDAGKSVPADVSVCAVAAAPLAEGSPVPLTTVDNPLAEMAERGVESLIARINGLNSAVHVLLAPQLVVRGSSVPTQPAAPRGRKTR
jgi:DNA-binding LacI/PurR family transcriptional regulator